MIGSFTNYYFYNTLNGEHISKYGTLVSALFTWYIFIIKAETLHFVLINVLITFKSNTLW